jgi:hypothetical protein
MHIFLLSRAYRTVLYGTLTLAPPFMWPGVNLKYRGGTKNKYSNKHWQSKRRYGLRRLADGIMGLKKGRYATELKQNRTMAQIKNISLLYKRILGNMPVRCNGT